MNVFDLRQRLVSDYSRYTRSFIKISDPLVWATVDRALDAGAFWPEPLLQLNPTFQPGGTIEALIADGTLHDECRRIFRIDKSEQDLSGKGRVASGGWRMADFDGRGLATVGQS